MYAYKPSALNQQLMIRNFKIMTSKLNLQKEWITIGRILLACTNFLMQNLAKPK